MQKKVQAVYDSLKAEGCPVMPGGNWSAGSLFEISGETAASASNELPWADYYVSCESMPFGVNPLLEKKLAKAGLMCEWINSGVLGVYKN
jgi:hypothetical protein